MMMIILLSRLSLFVVAILLTILQCGLTLKSPSSLSPPLLTATPPSLYFTYNSEVVSDKSLPSPATAAEELVYSKQLQHRQQPLFSARFAASSHQNENEVDNLKQIISKETIIPLKVESADRHIRLGFESASTTTATSFESLNTIITYTTRKLVQTPDTNNPTSAYKEGSIYLVVLLEFFVIFLVIAVTVVNIFRKNVKSKKISDSYFDVESYQRAQNDNFIDNIDNIDNSSAMTAPSANSTHISTVGLAPFPPATYAIKHRSPIHRHVNAASSNSPNKNKNSSSSNNNNNSNNGGLNEIRTIKSFFRRIVVFHFRPSRWFTKIYNIVLNNNSTIGRVMKDSTNSNYWMEMLVLFVLIMFIAIVVTVVVYPVGAIRYCTAFNTKDACINDNPVASAISPTYYSFGDYVLERCSWSGSSCSYDFPRWDIIIIIKYSLIVSAVSSILLETMESFPKKFQILIRWIFARFIFSICFSIDFENPPPGDSSLKVVLDIVKRNCTKCWKKICRMQDDEVDVIYDPNTEPVVPIQGQFYYDEFGTSASSSQRLRMLRACRITQLRAIDNKDTVHSMMMITNELSNLNKQMMVRQMTSGIGNLRKLMSRNIYQDPWCSWDFIKLKPLPVSAFHKENMSAGGRVIENRVLLSKKQSHRIRDVIDNMDDWNSKEEYLVLSFLVYCLPYRQQKLAWDLVFNKWTYKSKDNFLSSIKSEPSSKTVGGGSSNYSNSSVHSQFTFSADDYNSIPIEHPIFDLRFLIELIFFGVILLVIFIEGLLISDNSSYVWALLFLSSAVFTLFLFPVLLSIFEFIFHYQVISRLTRIASHLERHSKILLLRTRGLVVTNPTGNLSVKSCNNSMIQHINPACRTSRTFPKMAVSKLLMSINDSDVAFENINFTMSSNVISYYLTAQNAVAVQLNYLYNFVYYCLSLLPSSVLNSLIKILTAVCFYVWLLILNYLYYIHVGVTIAAIVLCFVGPFYDIIFFSTAQYIVKSLAKAHKRELDSLRNVIKDRDEAETKRKNRYNMTSSTADDASQKEEDQKKLVIKWLFGDKSAGENALVQQTTSIKGQKKLDNEPTMAPLSVMNVDEDKWDDDSLNPHETVNEGNKINSISSGGSFLNRVMNETSAGVKNFQSMVTFISSANAEMVKEKKLREAAHNADSDFSDSEDENFASNEMGQIFTRARHKELVTGLSKKLADYHEVPDDASFHEHEMMSEHREKVRTLNTGNPAADPTPYKGPPVVATTSTSREFAEAGGPPIYNAFEKRQEYFMFAKNRPTFQSFKGTKIIDYDVSDFNNDELEEVQSFHDDVSIGSQDNSRRPFPLRSNLLNADRDRDIASLATTVDLYDKNEGRPASPDGNKSISSSSIYETATICAAPNPATADIDESAASVVSATAGSVASSSKRVPKIEVSKHPKYSKYFTMLGSGLPKPKILVKMKQDWNIDHSTINVEQILSLPPLTKVVDETRIDENGNIIGELDDDDEPSEEEKALQKLKEELDARRAAAEKYFDENIRHKWDKSPLNRYYGSRDQSVEDKKLLEQLYGKMKPPQPPASINKAVTTASSAESSAFIPNSNENLVAISAVGKSNFQSTSMSVSSAVSALSNPGLSIMQQPHSPTRETDNVSAVSFNDSAVGGVGGVGLGSLMGGGSLLDGHSIEKEHRGLATTVTYLQGPALGKKLSQYSIDDGADAEDSVVIDVPDGNTINGVESTTLTMKKKDVSFAIVAQSELYIPPAVLAGSCYIQDGDHLSTFEVKRYRLRMIKDQAAKKSRSFKLDFRANANVNHGQGILMNFYNNDTSIRKLRQANQLDAVNLKQTIDKEAVKTLSTVVDNWKYFKEHIVFSLPVVEVPSEGFKQKYGRKKTMKKSRKFALLSQFPGFRIPKLKFDNLTLKEFYGGDSNPYSIDQAAGDVNSTAFSKPGKTDKKQSTVSGELQEVNDDVFISLCEDPRRSINKTHRCNRNESQLHSFLVFDQEDPALGKTPEGLPKPLELNFCDALSFDDNNFLVNDTPKIIDFDQRKTNHNTRLNCKPVYRKIEYSSRYSKYWLVNKQKKEVEEAEKKFGALSEDDLAMIEFEKAQAAFCRSQSIVSANSELTAKTKQTSSSVPTPEPPFYVDPTIPKDGFVHFSVKGVALGRPVNIDTRNAPLLISITDPKPVANVLTLRENTK